VKARAALCLMAVLIVLTAFSAEPAKAQQASTSPTLNVAYEVDLSQHFSLYSDTTAHVDIKISGVPGVTNRSVVVSVSFSFVFETVTGLPPGSNITVANVSQHPVVNVLNITLPMHTDSFDLGVLGTVPETTFAYRGAATIYYSTVSMTAPPYNPVTYVVLIPTSPRFDIVSIFPGTGPGLTTQYVSINGTSYLATGFSYAACFVQACSVAVGYDTISLIYQPQYFDYFLAAYLLLIVGALVAAGLILRARRQAASQALDRGRKLLTRFLTSIDSKKLLAALVVVSVLMVSLALVFGPSPTPRVYLAATPTTAQTVGPYVTAAGWSYLTPLQGQDEFDVMSSLGTYSAVVVADYPSFLQSTGFLSSSKIYVMTDYTNATLVKEFQDYFQRTVTTVSSPQQLQVDLSYQLKDYTPNHLGLPVSQGIYNDVTLVEGLLSLAIPFLALAFFARYMIESGSKGIVRLAYGVAFSFFVFMFGELVFIQTDVLLSLPVALHATISSAETAVGAIGFGGGSRPREVMGILGFLFGAVAGSLKGTKLDRVILIGVVSSLLFLLADPLQLGQDFYNLCLQILTGQPGTAFGQAAYTYLRAFIEYFMNAFGNNVVPTFYSQHGAVIFFAGAVPFALYTYVRRSTATLLLFYSAVVAGVGFVRIGDQDPLKAIASTTPGFAIAVVFIIGFLSIDKVERFLRLRLGLG